MSIVTNYKYMNAPANILYIITAHKPYLICQADNGTTEMRTKFSGCKCFMCILNEQRITFLPNDIGIILKFKMIAHRQFFRANRLDAQNKNVFTLKFGSMVDCTKAYLPVE